MSQISHQPKAPTQTELRSGGEVIDRHRHDEHQLIHVSAGVLAVQTEQGYWVASPDRALWIPAGTWHEHRVYGRSSVHTVGFPVSVVPLPSSSPTVVAAGGLLRELIVACTEADLDAAEAQRIRAVILDRLPQAGVRPLALPVAGDPRLAEACDLVTGDLRQPRALTWLANAVGASPRTLARLFRTEFGMTYPQWRTNARVFKAMIHLAEDATVTETAHHCGWATPSAFIDTFARTMGQTPGAYQAAATQDEPSRGPAV
jgi:AraC-like DNA-binding protein